MQIETGQPMLKNFLLCLALIFTFILNAHSQSAKSQWIDSVFNTFGLEEKIGQLFMASVYADKENRVIEIENEIKNNHIGGVVFMKGGGPIQHVKLTNHLQNISATPLFVAQDAQSGLGPIMDSTLNFPSTLALGAIQNDSLIYAAGEEIGKELKALGIHVNFAPVIGLDVSFNNRSNSFGSNRFRVAAKSLAFMRGLQTQGILACAKNFSLSGLTITDVQQGLPIVKTYADSISSYPIQKLLNQGLNYVMPTSAEFPIFYQQKHFIKKTRLRAGAITSIFAGDWLKKQMNFKGLVLIDIQGMEGSTKYRAGEAEMLAFLAGNDMLVFSNNIAPAIRRIKKLLKKQNQYLSQLDNSVKKILAAKYDAGLYRKTTVKTDGLIVKLNTAEGQLLNRKLHEDAITVIQNSKNLLPIVTLENNHFAYVNTNNESVNSEFYRYLKKYVAADQFPVDDKTNIDALAKLLHEKEVILVGLFPKTSDDVMQKLMPLLKELTASHQVIICDFGYLNSIKDADDFTAFISAYSNSTDMLRLVPQVIFGGIGASGQLSFSASPTIKEGLWFKTQSLNRFQYSLPEDAHMDSETLKSIDTIANEAIKMGATPGCHVFVAHEGKVVFEKSYGYLTYENKIPVTDETIYDLASVTKVSATLQAVMFLYEKGMIDINKKASAYLPKLKGSNKSDYTLKDILTHQAGLWPFLPFWAQTKKDDKFMPEYYSDKKSEEYPYLVAENLYASVGIKDSLWNWIIKSKVREKAARTPFDYRYSDMGFYILQHLSEKILNQPLDDFLQQNLYEPLGATTTGYLPLDRFPPTQIAPTENDKSFRNSLLVGTVHDQGAAMQGGVAGHAGLFSNASDLAKLGQMLLQEGSYGGYQYYKPETVRTFTQQQFETSRRGLGWDRPIPSDPHGPTSLHASPKTFGHTGFTGTCIWVDPEYNLVYVFLSNRVHPDMTNNKLINANIRPRIQDVLYKSIFKYNDQKGIQ